MDGGGGVKFTKRTYRIAERRLLKLEAIAFNEHVRCLRGPEGWLKLYKRRGLLRDRRMREKP